MVGQTNSNPLEWGKKLQNMSQTFQPGRNKKRTTRQKTPENTKPNTQQKPNKKAKPPKTKGRRHGETHAGETSTSPPMLGKSPPGMADCSKVTNPWVESRWHPEKERHQHSFSQVLHQLFGKTTYSGVQHANSALDCRDRLQRSNKLRLQQSTLHWIDSLVAADRRRLLPALTEFLDTRRGPGSGRPSGTVILRYCGPGTHPASHDIRTE